jgi:N-acetylmuramoyl-L-alanine amidase
MKWRSLFRRPFMVTLFKVRWGGARVHSSMLPTLADRFAPTFIILHHSLTKDGAAVDWHAIRKYHVETNGWSDCGYHYGVERAGEDVKIFQGRPILIPGAHTKDGGFNARSIGVCLVGNFDLAPPPADQWGMGLRLVRALIRLTGIERSAVIGHWEAQRVAGVPEGRRKSCPGRLFDMTRFRAELAGP